MKIHEYQAKALLRARGMPVPRGHVAASVDEARAASERLRDEGVETPVRVVKAQVHAGGRGKGGGVKVVRDPSELDGVVDAILGRRLVTPQTGPEGVEVRKVLVEEGLSIDRELYVALTLDRAARRPVLMGSTMGGTEIEEVAAEHPEAIRKEHLHPLAGFQPFQARRMAFGLGLAADSKQLRSAVKVLTTLVKTASELDASLAEVNPLVVTTTGAILALDAKMSFDDNGLFRHPEVAELRDTSEEDPLEVEASRAHLNYIRLDGTIGCMVNGAGLAMATMDQIKLAGGEPANFLDVGGTASADAVAEAFRILLSDANVKAVLINIFGGIVRCDLVAEGVVEAARRVGVELPVVVRIEGNRAAEARGILEKAPFDVVVAEDMQQAGERAVAAARGRA